MSDKPSAVLRSLRILALVALVASLACMIYGAWMMATDEGAPVAVFMAGAMLGAFASVLAARLKKR